MKKLFIAILFLLFVSLCACGQATSKELAPYNSILRKHYISSKLWGVHYDGIDHFALHDFDKDGTKELVLGVEFGPDIGILDVYRLHDNKTVLQDVTVWNRRISPPYLFENGTIRFDDREIDWISYYGFEDGELKLQACVLDQNEWYDWWLDTQVSDPPFPPYTLIDPDPEKEDIPLAKEKFEQSRKEMEGDGEVVELEWIPLAEYKSLSGVSSVIPAD